MGYVGIALKLFGGLGALTKILTIVGLLGGLYISYALWRQSIYNEGWNAHKAAVARADKKVVEDAQNARGVFLECRARGLSWDTRTGKCGGR